MRIALWILMILGWWSAGLLLSSWVVHCGRIVPPSPPAGSGLPAVDPRCPKLSLKCWIGSVVAVAYGVAWSLVIGLKNGFMLGHYAITVALCAVLGAAVARILCPKQF